jgi:chaperone BCS1
MESLREHLPSGVAEAAASIPCFTFISHVILRAFGIDIGEVVSFYLVLFGLYQGALLLYNKVQECFL